MKKHIIFAAIMLASLTSYAQSGNGQTLTVHLADGTTATYPVEHVDSITFAEAADDATDLGPGANTYIVPAAGRYSFQTKHVSGKDIENISKVDWIWSTKQADSDTQNYVSDITYANGKVSFTASDQKGDVVIAAFDANNNIVWTWLLWFTDTPSTMQYESGVTWMDRDLGATSANPADQAATWGLVWQWGRITPFFAGYATEPNASDAFSQAKQWTVVNPDYNLNWNFNATATTIADAIANPLTFYADQESCNWESTNEYNLWDKTKTDYDPSPAGFRLPQPSETKDLSALQIDEANVGYTYTYNGQTAWWPASGSGREYDSGCNIIGNVQNFHWSGGTMLYYYMPGQPAEEYWSRFEASKGGIYTSFPGNAAFAHALRCVVDK